MFIYKVTNNITGKVYVGKREIPDDWSSYYGSGKIIKHSLKKYGKENFTKEIIEECKTKQELNERERYWIKKLNTLQPNGYNISDGGDWGDTFTNNPNRESIREKYRQRTKGKGNPMYGKHHTKAAKLKVSIANTGRLVGDKNPSRRPEIRKILRDGKLGIKNPLAKRWIVVYPDGKKLHINGGIKRELKKVGLTMSMFVNETNSQDIRISRKRNIKLIRLEK
jgi:group I intron endonuclease